MEEFLNKIIYYGILNKLVLVPSAIAVTSIDEEELVHHTPHANYMEYI